MTMKSVLVGVMLGVALLLVAGHRGGTPSALAQATLPPRPPTATATLVPPTRPPADTAVPATETATLAPSPTAVDVATAVATQEPTAELATATAVPTLPVTLPDTGGPIMPVTMPNAGEPESSSWELFAIGLLLLAFGGWLISARRKARG